MSSTFDWCERTGDSFDRWWNNAACEIHHFIGKDIAYFHTLFWPAMLRAWQRPLPTRVHVHGFLTVNSEKISKRKGTSSSPAPISDHLSPDYLRYYLASKLTGVPSDHGLLLDEFVAKVNADLVGKVVNLASRTARFVEGQPLSAAYPDDGGLFAAGARCRTRDRRRLRGVRHGQGHAARDGARRPRERVRGGARAVGAAQARRRPGRAARRMQRRAEPLPPDRDLSGADPARLAADGRALFGKSEPPRWEEASEPLAGIPVGKFSNLMARVDPERVAAVITASASAA
jgi:methionyl-tRNA synthetase